MTRSSLDKTPPDRFAGIRRDYAPHDVERLRGSLRLRYSLAEQGTARLWRLLHDEPYVRALGALTGNQAMQMVRAGLQAIYLSGWQVAADANNAGEMYPDQSLYPASSVPEVVRRINKTLQRADQIDHLERVGQTVDDTSKQVFHSPARRRSRRFEELLQRIGEEGDFTSKMRW